MTQEGDVLAWYSVRCVFRFRRRRRWRTYEERITLWRAASFDDAITKAEAEARDYAAASTLRGFEYLRLTQAYRLFESPGDGAEVFSLLRDSRLKNRRYAATFFDTGRERPRTRVVAEAGARQSETDTTRSSTSTARPQSSSRSPSSSACAQSKPPPPGSPRGRRRRRRPDRLAREARGGTNYVPLAEVRRRLGIAD